MVKFKMKIWLVLAIIGFMAISMLFYNSLVNDFKPGGIFVVCLSRHNCQDVGINNVIESNSYTRKVVLRPLKFQRYYTNESDTRNNAKIISIPMQRNFTGKSAAIFKFLENDFRVKSIESTKASQKGSPTAVGVGTYVNLQYINKDAVSVNDNNNKFKARKAIVETECSKIYSNGTILRVRKEKLEHILVDETNKALFCYIPKVACTNWKRMLLLSMGKSKNVTYVNNMPSFEIHAKNLFSSLQNYSVSEVELFLQNYTKFIFVRNPLERLLSAYRNKLEQHYNSSKYFQSRFGKYIVKNFRLNPSNVSLARGDDVTFSEFVSYLVSIDQQDYNEHWQTMSGLCYPCFVNYDYIGKYENLMDDSKYFLNKFGLNYTFPSLPKPSQTGPTLKRYYQQLSEDLISMLYKIYEMDFRLFNYDIQNTLDF